MNARHRLAHRVLWPALSVLLLVGVGAGTAFRRAPERMAQLPEQMAPLPPSNGECSWRSKDAFQSDKPPAPRIGLALYPDLVEMEVLEPLRRPDPLVYLVSEAPRHNTLPADAKLLGILSDGGVQRFSLSTPRGYLAVFSLADGEVLGWAALGGQP